MLNNEYERRNQEIEIERCQRDFKCVKITFDNGEYCKCSREYWNKNIENECILNNWKIDYIY